MGIEGPSNHNHGHGNGFGLVDRLLGGQLGNQGPGTLGPGGLLLPDYGNGNQAGDGDPATDHQGRPGDARSTQAGSAVHQSYSTTVTGAPNADGPDAQAFNRPTELPSGVAVAKLLSHGNDAVPAGIARQLGDVAQNLASLTTGQAANTAPGTAADARLQAGPTIALQGHAAPQATAANAAATPTQGLANAAQANPAAQAATATPVPQAARGGEALATTLRPETAILNPQQAVGAQSAAATTAAAGNTAAQASAAALAAGSIVQPNAIAMPQGAPILNNPTVIPTNFINPHVTPQGTTFSRDAVIPADNRLSLAMQREGAYTGTGTARERLRGDVRQLPRRMNHWLARMGLVKPDAFARHQDVDAGEQGLQQWLYWILAIVAFLGCGLMLASLMPSGAGLLEGNSRATAGGFGLVAGIAAGLGAWWLRSQWRKAATPPESF